MTRDNTRVRLPVPFVIRLRRAVRACFMLLIIALIPFFLALTLRDSAANRFAGLVESESETVGPVQTSRILSIDVRPGQRVNAGDVLVRLDPAERTLDLAMQESRLLDYQQSLLRYEQDLQHYRQTLQESERRSREAVQEAAVALESEKMNRARDEAELAALNAEVARQQELVAKRLVSEAELAALRPKAQALEQTVTRYAPLISALQRRLDQASKDLEEVRSLLAATDKAPSGNPIREAMQRVSATVQQVAKSEPAVLRATRAGIVSRVQRQAGDVVVAGEPIVRVASTAATHIAGLLTQGQLADLKVGDELRVVRTGGSSKEGLSARVEQIDPEVMDLLEPFNPTPRYPTRGRRVRLQLLVPDSTLVPGESVSLERVRQGAWLDSVKRYCFF